MSSPELVNTRDRFNRFWIQVYADIVVNHIVSSDYTEEVWARQVDSRNRNAVVGSSQYSTYVLC